MKAWYKCRFEMPAAGRTLALQVPHDVFSTQQIDEGTLLLLEHLPKGSPRRILDMGCGYGALGLPLAALQPQANVDMVDRDLLAVHWAALNAEANKLNNTQVYGSLGYRDLRDGGLGYDWILCNVPARIGAPFIAELLGAGQQRLTAGGEVRVVVINDLSAVLKDLAQRHAWPLQEVAKGPRHSIFALPAAASPHNASLVEPADLYLRDQVSVGELRLDRPFDLGGDDPKRLAAGLPLLIDALPRKSTAARILCFRCAYGALPLLSRARWPEAEVHATDRDLLASTFTRRNAGRLGLGGNRFYVHERVAPVAAGEQYDLLMGELSPSAGEAVAEAEIDSLGAAIAPGGQALLLLLEKLEHQWIAPRAARKGWPISRLMARDGYSVLRLTGKASR